MSACGYVYDCVFCPQRTERMSDSQDSNGDCEPPCMCNGIQTQAIYENSMCCSQLLNHLCTTLTPAGFIFDFLNGGLVLQNRVRI